MNKKMLSCLLCITLSLGTSVALMGCNNSNQNQATNNSSSNQKVGNKITEEKAKDIMLKKVPNGKITSFSYDNDDNTPKYEGTLIKDNIEYDVDINAETGEIISFEEEKINDATVDTNSTKNQNLIGEDKAKAIMLDKVPNGTFTKFELDRDDNIEKYDAELVKDDKEYDISINAHTGEIISFSNEAINH